jgi:photosystem II stability/assembly factor-like uncharacterized protein
MKIRSWWLACACLAFLALAVAMPAQEVKLTPDMLEGVAARAIGPATMSGRIASVDAIAVGDRLHVYVGSASGGVWKSANGGLTFQSVFDKHTQSIGAVAIDRQDPNTVWVGTGEAKTRNSVAIGTGVYKTTNGGETWQHLGLADSEHIARIVIHPRDSKTVYVCALGHLWSAGGERGVYRTTDGGAKWEQVLSVDENTGCSDISIDPQEPSMVYAGMWQVRRRGWTFNSGGPGSGLYKSTDGGKTWNKMQSGLPAGPYGRIAVQVAPSRPSTVYAIVEAKKTALYRSDNGGETWREINATSQIQARPFYFATLAVDPKNHNRLYKPSFSLMLSEDGGKTFSTVGAINPVTGPSVHGDHHTLWIDPANTDHLIQGTDGGVYVSHDRGARWRAVSALPVSQFYRVSFDMDQPYNVYGGLQDNGTWTGPSMRTGGISNRHWRSIGFGDGFWALVDPNDPDTVYVEWQGGRLQRTQRSTGETKNIYPFEQAGETKLRFNWNTPLHLSPTQRGTLYIGAQYLYRSRDRGESWERISPDLTTNDPEKQKQNESGGLTIDNSTAENHCTIFTIAESPKDGQVIWVGTDDGKVQVTRDGGKTWTNVTPKVAAAGVPANTWVSFINASPHDAATAFATFDGHTDGNMKPYVYRTRDYGQTWESLATADVTGYAHVIRQDTVNPNLLFLGTEFGLFASIDGGKNWARAGTSLPPVAVRDLVIHPREQDLIIATHGRGIYIVDDLTPLRGLTPEVLNAEAVFLPSRPSVQKIPTGEQRFDGDADFTAYSPEGSAWITYYLKKRHIFGDLRIEVLDSEGKVIYTAPGERRRGVNRFEWPMRLKGPKAPPATQLGGDLFSLYGPLVPEGTYTVRMVKGKDTYSGQVKLTADPRTTHSDEDRALARRSALKLYAMVERLAFLSDSLVGLRDQARDRAGKLPEKDALRKRVEALAVSFDQQRGALAATREGGITGEEKLREKTLSLYGSINGYAGRPTQSQLQRMDALEKMLGAELTVFDGLLKGETAAVNAALEKKKAEPLKPMTEDEWRAKDQKK